MEALNPRRMRVMAAPRKYPDELRERAVRLVLDAKKDPVTRPAAYRRIGEQLGINPETLRGWVNQVEIDSGDRPGTTSNDAHRAEFGVEPICAQLQVAPSTYYAAKARPPSARSVTDAQVSEVIGVEHAANYGVYGAR